MKKSDEMKMDPKKFDRIMSKALGAAPPPKKEDPVKPKKKATPEK